jgi:rhomboid protease GluP
LVCSQWESGAGASGAIFGVAGAFLSFLLLKKAPISPEFAKRRLKSVAVFIFYNLFFGAVALRVNNAAHVGGLIAGLILGAVLPCVLRRSEEASSSGSRNDPFHSAILHSHKRKIFDWLQSLSSLP